MGRASRVFLPSLTRLVVFRKKVITASGPHPRTLMVMSLVTFSFEASRHSDILGVTIHNLYLLYVVFVQKHIIRQLRPLQTNKTRLLQRQHTVIMFGIELICHLKMVFCVAV